VTDGSYITYYSATRDTPIWNYLDNVLQHKNINNIAMILQLL